MSCRILFEDWEDFFSNISKDEIRDIVDLFYDGEDATFVFSGKEDKDGRLGSCMKTISGFKITLSLKNILNSFFTGKRLGGNKKNPHMSTKAAIVSVITHEIQHANQFNVHSAGKYDKFWGEGPFMRYETRPCEMDSRMFADDSKRDIDIFCDDSDIVNTEKMDDFEDIVSSFNETIDLDQATEILKAFGLYNVVNIKLLKERFNL